MQKKQAYLKLKDRLFSNKYHRNEGIFFRDAIWLLQVPLFVQMYKSVPEKHVEQSRKF